MIEENNKLIGYFLELTPCDRECDPPCGHWFDKDGNDILLPDFSKDWNALMPVVVKCKELSHQNAMSDIIYNHPCMSLTTCDIQKVYDAVINAIGYHNLIINQQTS